MKIYVQDKLDVRTTIVPWCSENFMSWPQNWQWFPMCWHKGQSATMFRIDNSEDIVAFKIRWGDYIL